MNLDIKARRGTSFGSCVKFAWVAQTLNIDQLLALPFATLNAAFPRSEQASSSQSAQAIERIFN